MRMRNVRVRLACVVGLMLAGAMASWAQDDQASPDAVKFKSLFSFDGANGQYPERNLVQGLDGNLYGTTGFGGTGNPACFGPGVVFKLTPAGAETTVYDFGSKPNCADGSFPAEFGTLALGTDGKLYGATSSSGAGGPSGNGTVFEITPGGALTTLYSFCLQPNCVDLGIPYSGLVRAADGAFYGIMPGGGANSNPSYCRYSPDGITCGAAYKITPQGVFSLIYSFCSLTNCTDGAVPVAQLISGTDGKLYGTTYVGGANNYGTVFSLTLGGKLTTLHSFNGTDGGLCFPCAPLVQANNGAIYGTSSIGGTNNGNGTFYVVTPTGTFTTLYNFCSQANCADGANPYTFVQATDGNFYGVTQFGGSSSNCGTVFEMTATGTLTTLHSFNGADGCYPAGIMQATNGALYGETAGGANGDGALVSLSVGLGPFVETLPSSGKVGAHVEILGSDLTGATSVTFNGIAAEFTAKSATLISATVPVGATSGEVEVVTPTRTLKSNTRFVVRP